MYIGHTSVKSVCSCYVFWQLLVTLENDDVSPEFIVIFIIDLVILVIRASGKSVRRFYLFWQLWVYSRKSCLNRIHCNFHYWAWYMGQTSKWQICTQLLRFFDRLIWLRHTSSQQIYVSFWRFFWQRYILKEFIVIFIIELATWVLLVSSKSVRSGDVF